MSKEPEQETAVTIAGSMSMQPLIELAKGNVPIETMRELVNIYREERAHQARTEFDAAFAQFKAACGPILHDKTANIATKSGAKFSYTFASLSAVERHVGPKLTELGFSYSWDDDYTDKAIRSTCVLWHKGGHSRRSQFQCSLESDAGQTPQQKSKSAMSFAHRCSLISVLGLSTTDTDTDGADTSAELTIGPGQLHDIEALIAEVGADKAKVLAFFDVKRLEDMTVSNYTPAVKMLEAKRGKA
jgi:hypothetical protein